MKILYIINTRVPTEKAYGLQTVKMCEAFARAGNDVELIAPGFLGAKKEGLFDYYGIEKSFKVRLIPVFSLVKFGKVGFYVQSILFSFLVFFYSLFRKIDFVFSRDAVSSYLLSFVKKTILEIHGFPRKYSKTYIGIVRGNSLIVSTNNWKKGVLVENFGINEDEICVAPNGVDLGLFLIDKPREQIKKELGVDLDKKIVVYSGHLYDWKGADILAESGRFLTDDILVLFIGGSSKDVSFFREKYKNGRTLFVGMVPHKKVPLYMKIADVLVLPNNPINRESEYETSPIKMFEYMAAQKPIVASSLPSIKEVLNDKNSVLVEAGNPEKLAEGIKRVLYDKELSGMISVRAFGDAQEYTWQKRAEKILSFINSQ